MRILFADCYLKKHHQCAVFLVDYFREIGFRSVVNQSREEFPGGPFDAIVVFNRAADDLKKFYPDTPIVLVDHGASNLKWFLGSKQRYASCDFFLTAGDDHVRSMTSYFGDDPNIVSTAFIKSQALLAPAELSREQFCEKYELDPREEIVLFAPTWHLEENEDITVTLGKLSLVQNNIVCQHVEKARFDALPGLNFVENEDHSIIELMKHAAIVISDTSSILYESAALNKMNIQLLLRDYPDNASADYELPLTAGDARLFLCGVPTRPADLLSTIENVSRYGSALEFLYAKVLAGTKITEDAPRLITAAIVSSVRQYESSKQRQLKAVDRGTFLKNTRVIQEKGIIARAGGMTDTLKYSNSREAIVNSSRDIRVIEVDVTRCEDGLILAHDNSEQKYGLTKPFSEISLQDFLSSKFADVLTPLSLEGALQLVADKDIKLVLNINNANDNYDEALRQIAEMCDSLGMFDKIIPQAYCLHDFKEVAEYPFYGVMIALGRHADQDIYASDVFEMLDQMFEQNRYLPFGLSLPYTNDRISESNIANPDVLKLFAYGVKVFVHDHPMEAENELLRANFGLFSHEVSDRVVELVPEYFNWQEYLHLNPDLTRAGISIEDGARLHWINFGNNENRLYRYDCPADFDWKKYRDLHPDLPAAGLTTENEMRVHYTKYGKSHRYRYK